MDFSKLTLEELRKISEENERQILIRRIMQQQQELAQLGQPQVPPRVRRPGPPKKPLPVPPKKPLPVPKRAPPKKPLPKREPPKGKETLRKKLIDASKKLQQKQKRTRRPRVTEPDIEFGEPPAPPGQDNLEEVVANMKMIGDPEFVRKLQQNRKQMITFLNHILNNLRLYLNATNNRLVIKVGNKYITLSRRSLKRLLNKLRSPFKESKTVVYDSWQWVETIVTKNTDISEDIEFIVMERPQAPNNDGGFFDKLNVSPFDLTKFGILTRYTVSKKKYVDNNDKLKQKLITLTKDHCIISTLKYFKFSEDKLDVIREKLRCNLKKSQLKEIANLLKIRIKLHHYKKNNTLAYYYYGNADSATTVNIALYNNHYFPYVEMEISPYMASNWKKYYKITNEDDYLEKFNSKKLDTTIIGKNGKFWKKKKNVKINSLSLVKRLDKSGAFVPHSVFEEAPEMTLVKGRKINLNCIDDECMDLSEYLKEKKEKKQKYLDMLEKQGKTVPEKVVFYADFETVTTTENKIKPFMVGISDETDTVDIFESMTFDSKYLMESIMDKAINNILVDDNDEIIMYFHNLKFDKTFFDKLTVTDKCKKDGQYYSIKVLYRGRIIEFRDSYKLIPSPLSSFGGMFNIECAKQVIPYKLYTQESISKNNVTIKEAVQELQKQLKGAEGGDSPSSNSKISEFLKSAAKFINKDGIFDHMGYMRYYLKMDCVTLGKGLRVFGDKIREVTNLETTESLTISSLMYKYCLEKGVFEGQYQVTGNLKNYLAKAVYGGRVCTRFNQKHHIKTRKQNEVEEDSVSYTNSLISDFDGVSLYPSAIARLCDEMGIPCGKPKLLKEQDLVNIKNDPKSVPYYILDIKITKVNKDQQIPFICYKNEEGSCVYTNTPPADQVFTIDSITLQDWINFHEIEYETLGTGVKFTKFNNKFGEVIKHLFEARLECKKKMGETDKYTSQQIAGFNALQQIYKLMLNSAYGKTIIKSSDQKTVYITRDKDANGVLMSAAEFDKKIKKYVVKNYNRIKCVVPYENYAESKEIESYRTAYNLAHVGVAILSMSKRIMNEVMGTITDLGKPCYYQDTDSMHILKDDIPEIQKEYKNKYNRELIGKQLGQFHNDFELKGSYNIYSNELIVLGKKCYMDVLQGTSISDPTVTLSGEHVRMKGVNKAGMLYQQDKLNTTSNKKIYEELYKGEELEFDLLYGGAFSIKYNDDHEAEERDKFTRTLKF